MRPARSDKIKIIILIVLTINILLFVYEFSLGTGVNCVNVEEFNGKKRGVKRECQQITELC